MTKVNGSRNNYNDIKVREKKQEQKPKETEQKQQKDVSIFDSVKNNKDTDYGREGTYNERDISVSVEDEINKDKNLEGGSEFKTMTLEEQEEYLAAFDDFDWEAEGFEAKQNSEGEVFFQKTDDNGNTDYIKVISQEDGANAKLVHTSVDASGKAQSDIYDMGVSSSEADFAKEIQKAAEDGDKKKIKNIIEAADSSQLVSIMKAYEDSDKNFLDDALSAYGWGKDDDFMKDLSSKLIKEVQDAKNPDALPLLIDSIATNEDFAAIIRDEALTGSSSKINNETLLEMVTSSQGDKILDNLLEGASKEFQTELFKKINDEAFKDKKPETPITDDQVKLLVSQLEKAPDTIKDSLLNNSKLSNEDKFKVISEYCAQNKDAALFDDFAEEHFDKINDVLLAVKNEDNEDRVNDILSTEVKHLVDDNNSDLLDKLASKENVDLVSITDKYIQYHGSLINDMGDADKFDSFLDKVTQALVDGSNEGDKKAINAVCKEIYSATAGTNGTCDDFLDKFFAKTKPANSDAENDFALVLLSDNYSTVNEGRNLDDDIKGEFGWFNSNDDKYIKQIDNARMKYAD